MLDGSAQVARVCDVPIAHIHFIWPKVRTYLDNALKRAGGGRFEIYHILPLLLDGKARLWVSFDRENDKIDGAVVTETIQYPCLKECRVWLVGGENLNAWFDEAAQMIEDFAKADGCACVVSGGRKGWIPLVTKRGYVPVGAPPFEKSLV